MSKRTCGNIPQGIEAVKAPLQAEAPCMEKPATVVLWSPTSTPMSHSSPAAVFAKIRGSLPPVKNDHFQGKPWTALFP
jgi:hypothetical protein